MKLNNKDKYIIIAILGALKQDIQKDKIKIGSIVKYEINNIIIDIKITNDTFK